MAPLSANGMTGWIEVLTFDLPSAVRCTDDWQSTSWDDRWKELKAPNGFHEKKPLQVILQQSEHLSIHFKSDKLSEKNEKCKRRGHGGHFWDVEWKLLSFEVTIGKQVTNTSVGTRHPSWQLVATRTQPYAATLHKNISCTDMSCIPRLLISRRVDVREDASTRTVPLSALIC